MSLAKVQAEPFVGLPCLTPPPPKNYEIAPTQRHRTSKRSGKEGLCELVCEQRTGLLSRGTTISLQSLLILRGSHHSFIWGPGKGGGGLDLDLEADRKAHRPPCQAGLMIPKDFFHLSHSDPHHPTPPHPTPHTRLAAGDRGAKDRTAAHENANVSFINAHKIAPKGSTTVSPTTLVGHAIRMHFCTSQH